MTEQGEDDTGDETEPGNDDKAREQLTEKGSDGSQGLDITFLQLSHSGLILPLTRMIRHKHRFVVVVVVSF